MSLADAQGTVVKQEEVSVSGGEAKVDWQFAEGEVELWWPAGHGAQPLYTVQVELVGKVRRGRPWPSHS